MDYVLKVSDYFRSQMIINIVEIQNYFRKEAQLESQGKGNIPVLN
jgi:hypothetical protein